ncbi:response regulator transcription factor [Luteococcus sp. OSA5]|uniref:response regulator transcription factor n=1 Tax=Luteococcus sp. OSA5 TaxID=3401630 RepID=UPI003B431ADE
MNETAPRALVVDDETQMLGIVGFALETQGFEVVSARSAEQAWSRLRAEHFDLLVLDVTLPGASGVQLCERVRVTSDVPVMMLTARTTEQDRIAGLLAGADDYVTKPFSPRELALRAQAIVRRTRDRAPSAGEVVVNGPLRIDPARREVRLEQRRVQLSDVELRLLVALARRAGQVVTWAELLNEVWATGEQHGGRDMIKTTVYRLRQHLGVEREWITAVRGTGYLMVRLDEPQAPLP